MNKKAKPAFDYTWDEIRDMNRKANSIEGRRIRLLNDFWDEDIDEHGDQDLVCFACKGELGTIQGLANEGDTDFEILFDSGEWGYVMSGDVKLLPEHRKQETPKDAPKQLGLFGDEVQS